MVILDDDPIICSLIEEIVGVKAFPFKTATELLAKKKALNPIGVFVDVHLAHEECGLDIIPALRTSWPRAPVIVITSDGSEDLIYQALSAGANDFILKPVRHMEVIARLNARREELKSMGEHNLLEYGDITIDLQHNTINGPHGQFFQSSREIGILAFLIKSSGTVVPKAAIKRHVWGNVAVSDNAVDRKIFEVRKAVKQASEKVEMKSVYGRGIVLRLTSFAEDQVLLEDKELELQRLSKTKDQM